MSTDSLGQAHQALPTKANSHPQAYLALPLKAYSHSQAHPALPMKTSGHWQILLAQRMSPSSLRRPCGALAQKCKQVGATGAEQMEALLPNSLQASAGKSTAK